MKQTAVEWLEEQIKSPQWRTLKRADIIEQAKQMEKEQIMDAYWEGGQDVPVDAKLCEIYYNETFK